MTKSRAKKSATSLACVILAAGKGTRMKSSMAKVLHPLAGLPIVSHVVETARALSASKIITVIAPNMDDVAAAVAPNPTVVQKIAKGTGDAVKAALPALKGFKGDVLVLYGDVPAITSESLKKLISHHRKTRAGITVLGMTPPNPTGYGRLVLNKDGTLQNIVEEADANSAQKKITLCNSGIMVIDGAKLNLWLGRIKPNNKQKEFYLVDLPAIAAKDGYKTAVIEAPYDETRGVNNRVQLAEIEKIWQSRKRIQMMESGVTLQDPDTVYFSADTKIKNDVVIGPGVVFGPGVSIDSNVEIRAYSHLEGVIIQSDVTVGPFARIRPNTVLAQGSRIGNFVEVKNSKLAKGVKANHLSYIGDAFIGEDTNFGCGAITVNYDGINKNKTTIGKNVMVGCNVNLVAPVTVQDGAYVAAGSTITEEVPADALVVARARAIVRDGWAHDYHKAKSKKKK